MKNITFVASYSLKTHAAICNRLTAYIKQGLAEGYTVRLVSPDEDIPGLPTNPNLQFITVPSARQFGNSFAKRAVSETIIAWRAMRAARAYRDSPIIISIPSMFLLFLSPLLGKSRRYLDVRDLSWEYLSNRSLPLRISKNFLRILAKLLLKNYECVITTNNTDQDFLIKNLSVPRARLLLIPNGVAKEQFQVLSTLDLSIKDKSPDALHHTPVISYIGNVGLAQNLMTFVSAAKQLPHVKFNIVGAGTDFERIKKEVKNLKLSNIELWGRVSWDKIPEFYAISNVLYAQLTQDYSRAMPSKLYEYLSTGCFIIYGGKEQAESTLAKFDNYVVVPPENVDALVKAIRIYIDSPLDVSQNNKKLIEEHFIREDVARKLYHRLLGNIAKSF